MSNVAGLTALSALLTFSASPATAWLFQTDGTSNAAMDPIWDSAHSLALDKAGDVIAGGTLNNTQGRPFTVIKLRRNSGSEIWRQELASQGDAAAVATDDALDVFAAGAYRDQDGDWFSAVKLSGTTGVPLWLTKIATGGGTLPDLETPRVEALAIDAGSNAVVAGCMAQLKLPATNDCDFAVVKLNGNTGAEQWRYRIDGQVMLGPMEYDDESAAAVAIVPVKEKDGDVVAAGSLLNGGSFFNPTLNPTVVKLSGDDGGELWRHEVTDHNGALYAVAVDAADNVVAAGSELVIKLDGTTGAELWRTSSPNATLTEIALTPGGDVIVAGTVSAGFNIPNMAVRKLAGGTGLLMWATQFDGSGVEMFGGVDGHDFARALGLDGSGNAIVAGWLNNAQSRDDLAVAKVDGTNGMTLWKQEFTGTKAGGFDRAEALAVASDGTAIAAGFLENNNTLKDFVVMTLNDGNDDDGSIVIPAKSFNFALQVKFEKKWLWGISGQPSAQGSPAPGSAGDPAQHGAVLELSNPATQERAVFVLPASGWRGLGRVPGSRGFKYLDPQGANGACAKVVVVPGKQLTATCKLVGRAVAPFSLDERAQGTLDATLKLGSGVSYCLSSAGGTLIKDVAMTAKKPGTFQVKNAPAPASCP
jgi:hypothetical protein